VQANRRLHNAADGINNDQYSVPLLHIAQYREHTGSDDGVRLINIPRLIEIVNFYMASWR
jgi:hypothetical protein